MSDYFDVVFDGPPSHESGRFVEVESPAGTSVRLGEWIDRGDGYWALRFPKPAPAPEAQPCLGMYQDGVPSHCAGCALHDCRGEGCGPYDHPGCVGSSRPQGNVATSVPDELLHLASLVVWQSREEGILPDTFRAFAKVVEDARVVAVNARLTAPAEARPVVDRRTQLATIEAWQERVQNGQMSPEDFVQKVSTLVNKK